MGIIYGNRTSPKGRLILQYLDKWPNLPSRTLARLIFNENPEIYKSAEDVRTNIRIYRGMSGGVLRNEVKEKRHFSDQPFQIKGIEEDSEPFILKCDRMLLMADSHSPYHNLKAVNDAIMYGVKKDVDTVFLNGDMIDMYEISRFLKIPRHPDVRQELLLLAEFLTDLHEATRAKIYYKIGNHEERWDFHLLRNSPELFSLLGDLPEVMRLFYGIDFVTWIGNRKIIQCGKLNIAHGQEFGSGTATPVNPARTVFLRAKSNIIVSHWHRSSENIGSTIGRDIIGGWSTGCLCELHPFYRPVNEWNLGFAYIVFNPDGTFWVNNRKLL